MGISDYASTAIAPKLLQVCHHKAPGIDLRLIGYEKDRVDVLLEQPTVAVVLGSTFQNLPPKIIQQPLMEERFMGICRKEHPALIDGSMSLETFAKLPHALFTLRRDDVGAIDRLLAEQNLQRRIIVTTPYFLTLPAIVADTDIIATIPSRLAQEFAKQGLVDLFELPLPVKPWTISMLWNQRFERSPAYGWLRQTIQQICAEI